MTEDKSPLNGNGVWKWIGVTLGGLILGAMFQNLRQPTNLVTESELSERVLELQQKIDSQTKEIVALRASVNQQSVDIAGIATKVGVTAHPVIAPQN
jgi:hypothetical protein